MNEVSINTDGFAIIKIYARCRNTAEMKDLGYKVDSGANCTTISLAALIKLGYSDDWVRENGRLLVGNERPSVATGQAVDNCYIIKLPEIHIGGYVGYNWPVRVSLDAHIQFRLLFGTDSMRFFKWEFDYEAGVCRYVLIPGKRQVLFNSMEQSIHAVDDTDS